MRLPWAGSQQARDGIQALIEQRAPINLCQPGRVTLTHRPRGSGQGGPRRGEVQPAGRGSQAGGPVLGEGVWGSASPPGRRARLLPWQGIIGARPPPADRPGADKAAGQPSRFWEVTQARRGFINRSLCLHTKKDARTGSVVKNPPANAGQMRDMAWIHGSGRSPRGGNDNPLQCSCLESPMDRGAWWAAVRRVTQSRTAVTEQPTPALVVRGHTPAACGGAAFTESPLVKTIDMQKAL